MSVFVAGLGIVLSLAVMLVSGVEAAKSAAIGAALAVVNWYLLRYLVGRVVHAGPQGKAGLLLLVFLKMGALMGLIALLLFAGVVQPIAFTVGLSSLAGGLLFGSILHIAGGKSAEVAGGHPAESER